MLGGITMEKKTIGKFISALRKANGMTQKELGERLFISDKTVSRWECDECLPELSLIPSIAEIFGITTDELLRGERNNPDREAASEDAMTKQKAKSDKQFKLMLDRGSRKYKNLTLISVGITVFGFLAALIANVGFSKGLIAFCLAAAFCVASEICQICFAINARITPDEDADIYTDKIQAANTGAVKTAVTVTFINVLLLAFCLPLVTMINGANYGLVFEHWLVYGLIFSAVAFVIGYIIYALFVRKALMANGTVTFDGKQTEKIKKNNRLLAKTASISAAIALVLGVCIVIWDNVGLDVSTKEYTFDSCADFKEFMESDYERWYNEGYSYVDEYGDVIFHVPLAPGSITVSPPDQEKTNDYYPKKIYREIKNRNGEVICGYYYNPDLYAGISFTESADDKMPVTVITNKAHYDSRNTYQTVESVLYALVALDFAVAIFIYLLKAYRRERKGY